jgi:hypothetical protein
VHADVPAGWLSIGVDEDGALEVAAHGPDGAPVACTLVAV